MNARLTSCKDCGGAVSKSAKKCPHCGRPQNRGGGCLTLLLVLGIPFAILILIAAKESQVDNPSDPYGGKPIFAADAFGGEPSIPTGAKRELKRRLKDPDSLRIRELISCDPVEWNGQKCYQIKFTYSARNGLGGMTSGQATAWMRGSTILGIQP